MTYRERIESMRAQWIGREVTFKGERHKVVGVDYNGGLEIDKPAQFTETTIISTSHVEELHPVEIEYHGRRYAFRNCDTEGKSLAEIQQLIKNAELQYEPNHVWLRVPGLGYGWPVNE